MATFTVVTFPRPTAHTLFANSLRSCRRGERRFPALAKAVAPIREVVTVQTRHQTIRDVAIRHGDLEPVRMPLTGRHVDVGLPVYNAERYLAQALDSLLGQTHEDLEVWISDNGSTDDTPAVARAYVARDPRVHYERQEENRGAGWNFDHVKQHAHSDYFKWAAHDDLVDPTYLARCVGVLEAAPEAVIAQPRTVFIDEHDRELLRSYRVNEWDHPDPAVRLRTVLWRNHDYTFAFGVIRGVTLRQMGPYLARYGADELLLAELALRGRFLEVDEHLFHNRLHMARSMVRNTGLRQRLLWNTWWSTSRGSAFPMWRFLADVRDVVRRVPLDAHDRRACQRVLLDWIQINWYRLGLDVPLGLEQLVRRR
jgi:glycosyltransferase involved in cell wall biosynthesis